MLDAVAAAHFLPPTFIIPLTFGSFGSNLDAAAAAKPFFSDHYTVYIVFLSLSLFLQIKRARKGTQLAQIEREHKRAAIEPTRRTKSTRLWL